MKFFRLVPFFLLMAGCSSVSVIDEKENASLAPRVRPVALYVRPFAVASKADFQVAPATLGEDVRSKVGQLILDGVLSRGNDLVASTGILKAGDPAPEKGLLLEGVVLFANQGSRALRLGIGFGLGRSRLETAVKIYNLEASRKKPWITCRTTGGSNHEPGLVTSLIMPVPITLPVLAGAVAGGAMSTISIGDKGVTQDSKRTGRVIAAVLHDHLVMRGLIRRKAWPKRSGLLALPPLPTSALVPATKTD
ncbi:MAG: DUF4410 domain-containing protein [Chthoniobacterales bacterium]|jgi:hypothetical protein